MPDRDGATPPSPPKHSASPTSLPLTSTWNCVGGRSAVHRFGLTLVSLLNPKLLPFLPPPCPLALSFWRVVGRGWVLFVISFFVEGPAILLSTPDFGHGRAFVPRYISHPSSPLILLPAASGQCLPHGNVRAVAQALWPSIPVALAPRTMEGPAVALCEDLCLPGACWGLRGCWPPFWTESSPLVGLGLRAGPTTQPNHGRETLAKTQAPLVL